MTRDQIITSTANPAIRAALALRDRRDREATGRTLVDGARELRRAVESGCPFEVVFVCPELITGREARAVVPLLEERAAQVRYVAPNVLTRLAFGERAEGIVGVLHSPALGLERLEGRLSSPPLIAVVEAVEKPGNLGAILRAADGAGMDAVIVADPRTDCFNPNVIRASLGTIFTVPLARASTEAVVDWLGAHDLTVVAARVDAARLYTEVDLTKPVAIVLGSEAEGLSSGWPAQDTLAVRLPMLGVADSLNVAAAAAVLFYEARRQRDRAGG